MTQWFDRIGVSCLRFLVGFFQILPVEMALVLGRLMGVIIFWMPTRRKSEAYADIKSALGNKYSEKERWGILMRLYAHFGQMAAEVLRATSFNQEEIKKYVKIHHWDRCEPGLHGTRGLILLTAHLGNWELVQFVPGNLGYPIHVLAQDQKHPLMNDYLNRMRESQGKTVSIAKGMGLRGLLKVVRRHGIIGMLGDRTAGRREGKILPFFGRKTTMPTGAFEFARRTGSLLVPCFFPRNQGHYYDFFIEEPIECGSEQDEKSLVESAMKKYIHTLEEFIRKYPDQYLWFGKRWKYSWTKRLLILSDGKPGHEKQSDAIVDHFRSVETQYGRPGMEYPAQTVQVRFRSAFHKYLFAWFSLVYRPFAQGKLGILKAFLDTPTFDAIQKINGADFVISSGSGLVPLNLILAKDFCAKSVVLMKPGFPFNLFRYDLAVIPAHDRGWMPEQALRPILTPNPMERSKLEKDAEKLRPCLKDPSKVKFGLFLGGNTRDFTMGLSSLEYLFAELQRLSKKYGDYLITTSRRTPDVVVDYFRDRTLQDPSCQMFVVAKQDPRPEVVGGMMALSDILIVTEDSISMISEAVSTGKKVIILTFGSEGLPKKHVRFRQLLKSRSAVMVSEPEHLEKAVEQLCDKVDSGFVKSESEMIRKKLQEIL